MEITATKQFSFCYGHHLPDYDGKCCQQHGHNAHLEVEVRRPAGLGAYPGMVMDFKDLKTVVDEILEVVDHRNLNDLPYFQNTGNPPTCENLARFLFEAIDGALGGGVVVRLRLSETPTSWVDIHRGA